MGEKEVKENAEFLSEAALLKAVQTTDFEQQQLNKGRDYCYVYRRTQLMKQTGCEDYGLMVYTLNEPQTLESAAKRDIILSEDETFIVHRIAVIRNGQLVDKLADTQLKVLDNEHQSGQGMLTNNKTVNMLIRDLHLNDILVFETTIKKRVFKKTIVSFCTAYQIHTGLTEIIALKSVTIPAKSWFIKRTFSVMNKGM